MPVDSSTGRPVAQACSTSARCVSSPDGILMRRTPSATSMSTAWTENGVEKNSMPIAAQWSRMRSC